MTPPRTKAPTQTTGDKTAPTSTEAIPAQADETLVRAARPASLKRPPRPAADQGIDPVDTKADIPAQPRTPRKRGPYNVQRLNKKAATFRLPQDVHDLIDKARQDAATRGDRLTKDEAITMAVRSFWGKQRQRRRP